jgi:hypothetical protein
MMSGEPLWIIVGQLCLAMLIFPDESLKRQIDASGLIELHQRRAASWISKNDQPRGTKLQARVCGVLTVIDLGEYRQAGVSRGGTETPRRFGDIMWTPAAD